MGSPLPRGMSAKARTNAENMPWRPRNCVWEITLACNLRCAHCGSRAGKRRPRELDTDECLDVVEQLAELGCELVTLSGGEPTLRGDWDVVASAIARRGIPVNMVTNAVDIDDDTAARAVDAGMCNVGVSIDGPRRTHDRIRGDGTFERTLQGIGRFLAAGLDVGIMTTVNRLNFDQLEDVRDLAASIGASSFRMQLGKPMGSMDDGLVIRPRQFLDLVPRIARMKRGSNIAVNVGDSIGYYGPHDRTLRGRGWRGRDERWQGCQAGMNAIGIESDGGVKGCLSMQARHGDFDPFREGSIREASLAELWFRPGAFGYNRDFTMDDLSGFCRRCSKAAACRGGARCVSSAVTGELSQDPFCYHRVASIERGHGLTRTVVQGAAAASAAFVISVSGCGADEPQAGAADPGQSDSGDVSQVDTNLPKLDIPPSDPGAADVFTDPGAGIDIVTPKDTPDVAEAAVDPGSGEDVVAQKDVPGTPDVIDCSQVCCMCDYGIIPEDVWEACCAPPEDVIEQKDATVDTAPVDCAAMQCFCTDVPVPPEVFKECCEVCASANCCDCDYGISPPPQCCPEEASCPEK